MRFRRLPAMEGLKKTGSLERCFRRSSGLLPTLSY